MKNYEMALDTEAVEEAGYCCYSNQPWGWKWPMGQHRVVHQGSRLNLSHKFLDEVIAKQIVTTGRRIG